MHISPDPRGPGLGVDIGRVIINGPAHPAGGDTAFFSGDEATMLATPEMNGAVAALTRLIILFDGRVWLVSKCGPRVQGRTLRWLQAHDFYHQTGLPAVHVRFCRTRADKRLHCQDLGLTTSSMTIPRSTPPSGEPWTISTFSARSGSPYPDTASTRLPGTTSKPSSRAR
jgi:hypothetical protein